MSQEAKQIPLPRDCTFSEADWSILSRQWFPIAVASQVTDRPVAARLLDVELVIFRGADKLVVARDLCPHRGMRLSCGWVDQGQIICPYHGLHFDAEGRCTSIPSNPSARLSARLSLTVLPSVERFGLVLVQSGRRSRAAPQFRRLGQAGLPADSLRSDGYRKFPGPAIGGVSRCRALRVGAYRNVRQPFPTRSYRTIRSRASTAACASSTSAMSVITARINTIAPPPTSSGVGHFRCFPPFSATLIVDYPEDKQLWILNSASPISARATRLFCPVARNFDLDIPVQAVRDWNTRVFNEDRVLVENQKPEDLPLDLSFEISIPADRTSVAYRRLLKQMGLSLVYAG